MSEPLPGLVQAAAAAAQQGRWAEAEQLWRRVLAVDPRHPQALYSLGVHAFKRGQLAEAQAMLQAAHAAAPREPAVAISLAMVLREAGDAAGELRAIEASLVADPYFLPALVAKAACLQRLGKLRAAADVYRNALKVVPNESQWPPPLRAQLLEGRALVEKVGREMEAFLAERLGTRAAALSPAEAERWREAGAIMTGQSAPYPSVCSRLQVPRLPAIPFFDRAGFDWVPEVESRTEAIIAEMRAAMTEDATGFRPYIAYEAGVPVNQWQELNHSKRWSSYFLWQHGQPIAEHLARCPETARALEAVDMADIGGLCPNAMFSALAPHTRIPPHHGETNARLVVHLPLVVPDHCLYRVGYERRRWTVGELLIFDDSIEHEARNDSDELRVVLIFDIWNPLLSPAEREMMRALSAASAEFQLQA
ncbi:aspartyl/asparaginyl beta-hydroxylase domain-containing protein [Arenimonas sp.]|uniref:aspartyl/asparaginyl beta-hydroxylase domain-containing protein n=1 Tax=Arenimonas sp. TaxID=1872635 RepID=UPI002E359090|nr:aspartyl/asparaginyl beta-hydroxylase domain-containing protein [Arenimonas sp.]HEX4853310.1 aspartyl/asparaginyl beta-hydroxylase domain-containing protein [Arenimonas sp.]